MKPKDNKEANKAQMADFLKNAVKQIRTSEDPYELNEYRKIFRSNVPFSLRSYFAAYLLKTMAEGKPLPRFPSYGKSPGREKNERFTTKTPAKPERRGKPDRGKAESDAVAWRDHPRHDEKPSYESSHPVLPEDASSTLFISIGKNRRVFPRDIISLILQNVEMDRDHIGDIRILDNYSFVQVITEDAGKIIEALTDYEYRGKKLTVSYSRKKDEKDEETDGAENPVAPSANSAENPVADNADGEHAAGQPEAEDAHTTEEPLKDRPEDRGGEA